MLLLMKKLLCLNNVQVPRARMRVSQLWLRTALWMACLISSSSGVLADPAGQTLSVNSAWADAAPGTVVGPNLVVGENAFATLADAMAVASDGDALELAPGVYHGAQMNKAVTITATAPGVFIQGGSPALTVSGDVTFAPTFPVAFYTDSNDPTILIQAGTLTLRNCIIIESTNYTQCAIRIVGGTADLGTAVSPGGNNFRITGPGIFITNVSPNTVTAIGNTWTDNGTPITDPFQIEDRIHHALDAGGGGVVFIEANEVYVTEQSGSVQRGLNAIAADGTVNVDRITLSEALPIVVNKNAHVVGRGLANTTLQPAADTSETGDARGWWQVAACFNLDLRDLTLDGTGHVIHEAVRHHGFGQIVRVRFTHIAAPANSGVGVRAIGGCGQVRIEDCLFDDIGRAGIHVSGAGSSVLVTGTKYTGKGAGSWLDYAVVADSGAVATLEHNTIAGNLGVADGLSSAGVLVTTASGASTRAALSENSLAGNRVGVAAGLGSADASQVKLAGNNLTGNTHAGLVVAGGTIVDAGNCAGTDLTGFGASAGANDLSGYGFDNAAPWAIENANAAGQAPVYAQGNTFAAGGPGAAVEALLWDNTDDPGLSAVLAADTSLVVTCPPAVTVQCAREVPAAATTLDAFAAQGGAVSDTAAAITSADVVNPAGNIITRTYTVTDAACQPSQSCTQTIAVTDTTAPLITCPPDQTVTADAGACVASGVLLGDPVVSDNCGVANVTHDAPPQFPLGRTVVTWTVSDGAGNTATCPQAITVRDAEAPRLICGANRTVECDALWDFTPPIATDNCDPAPAVTIISTVTNRVGFCGGTFAATRTWSARDAAGNEQHCEQTVTLTDTTVPALTCAPDRTVECGETWEFTPPTATDACGTPTVTIVSTTEIPACGNTRVTARTWRATDACGHTAECTQTVTLRDTTPPALTCPGTQTVQTAPGRCDQNVAFSVGATDACSSATVVCTPESGSTFPIGTTTVQCRATDACGLESTCSFAVVVVDEEAPVVACPSAIVVNNTPGQCTATVSFTPTVTDNCTGAGVVCTPPSGQAFPAGVTTVLCAATDAAGNTANCSFTVTVNDIEPPVLTCPGNLVATTDAGRCSAVVDFVAPVTDNCANPAVVCTPASHTAFPKGATLVRCVATDAAGLTAACEFTVSVTDAEAPVIVCPANISTSAPPGQCQQVVSYAVSATDNCPSVTWECQPPSGSVFAHGVTAVACTATDAAGLTGTCTFSVTVADREPPRLTFVPPDVTVDCGSSLAPANTGGAATAADTCDAAPTVGFADAAPYAVTSAAMDGWSFAVQGFPLTAAASLSSGPGTPPLGAGSFHASIGANGENLAELRNFGFDQVPLAAVSELSYWTYRIADGAGLNRNINLILNLDTDGDGAGDDVLYFEPRFQHGSNPNLPDQGAIVSGTWQRWNAGQGGWYSLNHPEIMGPGANVQRLAAYLVAFPQAQIVNGLGGGGVRLVAGGGAGVWDHFQGSADACVIGIHGVSTAYNFDVTSQNTCPTVVVRTWTATDRDGNATSSSQRIVQAANGPPPLACPANRSVECAAEWTFGEPAASASCGPVTVTLVDTVTNQLCGRTYAATRTWEALDSCGNRARCSQTVTVQDTIPPVVTCPGDVVLDCTASTDPIATGVALALDGCSEPTVIAYTDTLTAGTCPEIRVILRSWTATDACGNVGHCEQRLSIVDTQPPTVTCTAPKTVECGQPWSFDPPSGTDVCGSVTVTEISTTTNRTCGESYQATRTWRIADACGNALQCAQTVTVQDTTGPIITAAPDKTVECGQPWNFEHPTYSDECIYNALVYNNAVHDLNNRLVTGTNEIGDEIVLEGTARQITRFQFEYFGENRTTHGDFEGPVTGRVRFYANDGQPFNGYPTPGTILYDSGAFPVPATARSTLIIEDFQLDAAVPLTGDVPGTFTWTVQFSGLGANDTAGVDLYSPAVVGLTYPDFWQRSETGWQLKQDDTVPVNFAARIDAAQTALRVHVVNTVTNASCGQTFTATRTWEAVDPCGNANQCRQTVTVIDTTGPVLVCPSDLSVECGSPTGPERTGTATATDPCSTSCTVAFADATAPGSCAQGQVITRTWTATDVCGNSSTCRQIITVVDTTPPRVSCPPDVTLVCDADVSPGAAGTATAVDDCDPQPVITHTDGQRIPGTCGAGGALVRTWTATDACGNRAECIQRITLRDTVPPVITCPANVTVECQASLDPAATGHPTVVDNCDPSPATTFADASVAGSCAQARTITRTWTATDACGNPSQCVQTITVVDTTPPVVTCPPNVTVSCGAPTAPTATGTATALDACAGTVAVSYSDSSAAGTCPQLTVITRTWTTTDPCGNVSTGRQTITIADTTPPAIVCPATLVTTNSNGACSDSVTFTATATDDCSSTTVVCSPPSGASFPKGTNMVTCTATDACGNRSSCQFAVVVEPLTFLRTVGTVIPDNNAGGVTNTIAVNTPITRLTDVEVILNVSHTWNGDLYAYLVHGSGRAVLLNRVGRRTSGTPDYLGYSDDGFNVILDDEAPRGDVHVYRLTLFGNHTTPITGRLTGTWAPDGRATSPALVTETDPRTQLLSAFRGLDPNGTWTLVIADRQAGDVGTLLSWGLRMCGELGDPPTIVTQPASITVECGTDAVFSVSATGTEPMTYQWYFGTDPIPGATAATLQLPATLAAAGSYSVVVQNRLGSAPSQPATLSPVDTRPPQIVCPAERTVATDPGQCSAVIAALGLAVSDSCSPATVVCVPPAGTTFPKGSTRVDCTATDAANNAASCSFVITVEDRELPSMVCPADVVAGTDPGQCTATVAFDAVAADNCPGVTLTCVPPSGSVFAQGPTPVTCTAVDTAGNRRSCGFTVWVQDTSAPEVCMDAPAVQLAGTVDSFVGPEPSSPSVHLQAYLVAQTLPTRPFDRVAPAGCLAHSFGGFAANVSGARLTLRVAATPGTPLDDQVQLVFSQAGGALRAEQWTRPFGTLSGVPGLLGNAEWTAGSVNEFTLDLARLPNADGTTTDLLPVLRQEGALDVLIADATDVDYVMLELETCQCSTSLEAETDPGQCSARVLFPPPVFFDNCDLVPAVVCDPPSGSRFPLGLTVVDCTATDTAGNVGHCSFNVTVNDVVPDLTYARSGSTVVLSWPRACSEYELDETSSLTPPIQWTHSSATITNDGAFQRAAVPVNAEQKYFRLRKVMP